MSVSSSQNDDTTIDLSQLFIHGIPLYHDYFFNHYRAREIEQKFSDRVYQGIDSSVLMKFPRVADAVDLLYSDELNELQQRNNNNVTNTNEKSPSLSLPPLSSPARNLFFGESNDTSANILQATEDRDQDGEQDEFLPMMVMSENATETSHQHHSHDHSPPLATLTDDEDDENLNPRKSSPPTRQEYHNTPSRTKRQEENFEGNNDDEEQVLDFEEETDTEEQDQQQQQQQNELLESAADDFYHNGIMKKSFLRWFNKWCTQFETSTQQIEFLQQSQSHFRLKNLFDKWIWRYDKAVWLKQREEEEREEEMKQLKMEQQKFLHPLSPKKKVGVDKDDNDDNKFENVGVLHHSTVSDEQHRDREQDDDDFDESSSFSQLEDLESKVQKITKLNLLSTTFRHWKTRLSHRMTDAVFRIAVQSSLEPTTIDYFVEEAPDAIDEVELDQSLKNASLSILYAVERKDHLLDVPPSLHDDRENYIISRTSSSHHHHHNTSNAKLILDCEDDITRNCIKRWRLKLADVRKKKMLSHQEDSRMGNGDERTSPRQNQSPPPSSNRQQQQDSISPNFINDKNLISTNNNTSPSAVANKMMRRARRQTWKAFCHRLQARHVLMIEEQRRRSNDNYSGYSSPRSSSSRVGSPTQRKEDFPAMMNTFSNENEKMKSSPSPQNPSVQQATEMEQRKLSSSSSGINPNNKKRKVVVTKRIKVKSKADHHDNTSSTSNPRLFSVSQSTARNSVSPSASPEPTKQQQQHQQSNSQYSKNDDNNNNDQRSSVSSSSVFVSEDLIALASKMLLSSSSNHNNDEKQIEEEEFILPPPNREEQNTNLLVEDISAIIDNNNNNNEKRTQGQVRSDDDDQEVERKAVNAIDNLHLDDGVIGQRKKGSNPLRNLNVVLAFHKLAESLAKNGEQ